MKLREKSMPIIKPPVLKDWLKEFTSLDDAPESVRKKLKAFLKLRNKLAKEYRIKEGKK